jgi:hypothetical protein
VLDLLVLVEQEDVLQLSIGTRFGTLLVRVNGFEFLDQADDGPMQVAGATREELEWFVKVAVRHMVLSPVEPGARSSSVPHGFPSQKTLEARRIEASNSQPPDLGPTVGRSARGAHAMPVATSRQPADSLSDRMTAGRSLVAENVRERRVARQNRVQIGSDLAVARALEFTAGE